MAQTRIGTRRLLTPAHCVLPRPQRSAVAALGSEAETQLGIGARIIWIRFY